jgi:hypothetical protein
LKSFGTQSLCGERKGKENPKSAASPIIRCTSSFRTWSLCGGEKKVKRKKNSLHPTSSIIRLSLLEVGPYVEVKRRYNAKP